MKTQIERVHARQIYDSRGRPTVEVDIALVGGALGRGIAPAGASRGSREAAELRDGGEALGGYGVSTAVEMVNREISTALVGGDVTDQVWVDQVLSTLDGTSNFSRLGGNASIATSMAALNAAAAASGVPLWRHLAGSRKVRMPLPEVQIFGGGAHAGRRIDIQDLLVMPLAADSFSDAMRMVSNVYHCAGKLMDSRGKRSGVADEGGWWPDFSSNEEALSTLSQAIEQAGYRNGEVVISIDVAASEFRTANGYRLALEDREYTTAQWLQVLLDWTRKYPILSVEDPVGEDDPDGMQAFTLAVGQHIQIIGDDFLTTNADHVDRAAKSGACNAVLLKPNQAGTITATAKAMARARAYNWGMVVSARSGETEDATIAHLATGWDTGQIKVGSFARSERMSKWNELIRIEEEMGADAEFAGRAALPIKARA